MVAPQANSSILAAFSSERAEFRAPKYNSPSATTGTKTFAAPARRSRTPVSPAKMAMTMLVSRRSPAIGINPFALLLDRPRHRREVGRVDRAREAQQVSPRRPPRADRRQRAGEFQHLALLL